MIDIIVNTPFPKSFSIFNLVGVGSNQNGIDIIIDQKYGAKISCVRSLNFIYSHPVLYCC